MEIKNHEHNFHDPVEINRIQFVQTVFEISYEYEHHPITISTAINIGDKFVNSPVSNYIFVSNKYTAVDCCHAPARKIYSIELAHISLIISSKYFDESQYKETRSAKFNCNGNNFVYKLEAEVLYNINYIIPVKDMFFTKLLWYKEDLPKMSPLFYEILYMICIDPIMFNMDNRTLLLGIVLLWNKHKQSFKPLLSVKRKLLDNLQEDVLKIFKEE